MGQPTRTASILSWSYAHAAIMLAALTLVYFSHKPAWLVLLASLSLCWYVLAERHSRTGLWLGFGRANLLSTFRFIVLAGVVLFYSQIPDVLLLVLLIGAVILDGFDGQLARRFNESGEFGHYLDVEIDAFGIAALSVLLWHHQQIPALIFIAGALRYAYVWLIRLSVNQLRLEPKRRYASVIAVTVYVVMSIRLVFEQTIFSGILMLSCALLVASFARSLWFQWR